MRKVFAVCIGAVEILGDAAVRTVDMLVALRNEKSGV